MASLAASALAPLLSCPRFRGEGQAGQTLGSIRAVLPPKPGAGREGGQTCGLLICLACMAFPSLALAQSEPFNDPYDVPLAPRPPTLPELTHPDIEGTLESTAGAIVPASGGAWAQAYVQRINVEVPLALRRWYVGATYEFASGTSGNAFETVGGNLELGGRTLWATETGLGFGGGLSLVLPTASYDPNSGGAVVALESATLRPWDVTFFSQGVYGVRPYIDVRMLVGQFIAQFRQGIDMTVAPTEIGDRHLYAMTGLYFGWRATELLAVGLEAFEEYAILVPGVSDASRSAIVASPNIRVSLPWVQPAISMFTNVGPPLYGANESFWGFRLAITVVYDPRAMLGVRGQER
jgi:hypothetical protein